jgi:hypothetical protein
MQLQAAIGFRGEHPVKPGIVHRVIDCVREVPIGLSGSGVFGDQRADALDRAEQNAEGLICHDRSSPCAD